MALFEKCAAGRSSPEEMRLLEAYRDAFEWQDGPWDETAMGREKDTKGRIKRRLMTAVYGGRGGGWRIMRLGWQRYLAAAVVLVAVVVALVVYRYSLPENTLAMRQETILPGSNKAVLTLEDGSQIVLDEATTGALAERGNVSIVKLADGQLTYSQRGGNPHGEANAIHSVSTPRGGQYQLVLADGTKVWLNAASTIRFPAEFSAAERVVEISGEAYLEVAKMPDKPFIVNGNGQQITVLGTRFNVSAYPDDHTVQTALLQGGVRVTVDGADYQLAPGQRTVFDKRRQAVRREPFDAEVVMAWQRGDFMFDGEPVEQVMRKIGRWYDVEIAYQGSMQGKAFTGTVSRYEQVKEVLDMLAATGTVRFRMEGRRITVME